MHSILLIIEKPEGDTNFHDDQRWSGLSAEIGNIIKPFSDIYRPADNVLMIPVSTGLPAFAKICAKSSFPYRTLFLAEEPEWVQSKP